jgi:asparagine synthase (glutamine-hydrolysing)
MCGITGIVDLETKRPFERAAIERMNATLSHRGPDGDGFHLEPGVAFGHRRLSIIDLEGGRQPLYNEDGSVVVTYNGEIYNFQEIEVELRRAGHCFRTRCDTEVIVHAWEEWGVDCVDRFNGMFAFAIWDRNRQSLFLARDRIGIKPLYYALRPDGTLVFASELKAILAGDQAPGPLDPRAVEEYFTFGYVPDPRSIFTGIHKLPPAHRLLARRGCNVPAPERYWDVPLAGPESPGAGPVLEAELIEQLNDSVRLQLVSDVPLGAFLSGGIDSSAVVAAMRNARIQHLLTCSIGFSEKRYDESRYAQMVADAKATDHHVEIVEASDYGLLDQLVGIYDEPYADSSAIPTYRVCELARKHVTVALSGDGGDESFLGYRRYRLFDLEERVRRRLPLNVRRQLFGPLGRWYPKLDWAPRFVRGKTTFQALARDSAEAYLHGVSIWSGEMREELFTPAFKRELQGYRAEEVFHRHLEGKTFADPLRMVQYLDFQTYLPGDILTKVDRASMAHSLEVRVPLLDHHFVEWAARVPTAMKLRGGEGKAILKKALEPHLPHEVLYRDKMGFAVPLDVWFRDSLRERIRRTVTGERLKSSGYFVPEQLDRIMRQHETGARNHSAPLWTLLMFDGFLQQQRLFG